MRKHKVPKELKAPEGIVTSDAVQAATRSWLSALIHRKGIKIAAPVALVAVALVGGYLLSGLFFGNKDTAKKPTQDYSYNSVVSDLNGSNYGPALGVIDKEIASTTDVNKLQLYYMQKASLALQLKKYNDAMRYAQEAEKAEPSSSTAVLIAKVFTGKGDKAGAIKYYKIAISRLDPNSELDQLDARDYKQAITNLGGTP